MAGFRKEGHIYLHIFYIYCVILKINDIGVWVNRVRIMLLCLHSSFGEVLAIKNTNIINKYHGTLGTLVH